MLECSNTVTSLGNLSTGVGTVEYDGGTQNVLEDVYYNFSIDQSGTKTSQGNITVAGDMKVNSGGAKYNVGSGNSTTVTGTNDIDGEVVTSSGTYTANGSSDIDGTLTISTGTYNANGSSDVDGTISITGTEI